MKKTEENHLTRDHLIPILQDIQERDGYLSREALSQLARDMNLPASKVYGVATFYNQFHFQPNGKYHIQLCRGTACHVKGSFNILVALKDLLGIEPGQTTRDRMFSLEIVACIGACGLAPVIAINGEFHANLDADKTIKIIRECREKEKTNEISN